jgi:hypothetical protein
MGKEPFTVRKMVNYTGQKYETARSLVRHFLKEKMIKVVGHERNAKIYVYDTKYHEKQMSYYKQKAEEWHNYLEEHPEVKAMYK